MKQWLDASFLRIHVLQKVNMRLDIRFSLVIEQNISRLWEIICFFDRGLMKSLAILELS